MLTCFNAVRMWSFYLLADLLCSVVVCSGQPTGGKVVAWGAGTNYTGLWPNFGQGVVPSTATGAIAVSAGEFHSLALKSDGTVIAWGRNDFGQLNIPAGLNNVVSIASGWSHCLALKIDGTVVGWGGGNNPFGQATPPPGLSNVVAIAAGNDETFAHSLALKSDGTVVAWGDNQSGQLNIPDGLSNVVAISAGWLFSLALKSDGTVVGWGNNDQGQLNVPTGLSNVVAIAAGGDQTYPFSLALKTDGTVVGWGNNSYGQLDIPHGLTNVMAIAGGGEHSLALRGDGTVIGWGFNQFGHASAPVNLTNVMSIAAGCLHSLVIQNDGSRLIAHQPMNLQVDSGKNVFVNMGVLGTPPFGCQWLFNGTNINGATSVVLTLTNIQTSNSGNYTLLVTNRFGVHSNFLASLNVLHSPPIIISMATNQSVAAGSNATFTVIADGSLPLTWQWQFNQTYIDGATNASLVMTNIQLAAQGNYDVVVTNAFGVVTSSNVLLNVFDFGRALNCANSTWTSTGDAPWFVETVTTSDGEAAVQSGAVAHSQQSMLQTVISGPATLTYWWQVSSEAVKDYLSFSVNGAEQARISGTVGWQQNIFYLGTGAQILKWTYSKNGSVSSGSDAGWLDQVSIVSGGTAPIVTRSPANQTNAAFANAIFSTVATGTQPLYYWWYFNTTNLLQTGTDASLIVSNISASKIGQYTVVITNAYGSATSSVATLAFPPPMSAIVQPASQTNVIGTSMSFSVVVEGIGPLTYHWQFNGTNLPNNIITTVAGGGVGGDGGAATNAGLYYPSGVAFDAFYNLHIADGGHKLIRKVDANGIITTVAGNGNEDYSGDGVAATNTSLSWPTGVGVDASGNVFVADSMNNRVRKVDTNGIITTLAGNGSAPYAGDGGAATSATVSYPTSVALDTFGNLFIADPGNNRIRKVDTNGIITTVAGNGSATYAGDAGMATNASLNSPNGVALDALGNLFIADNVNQRVRKVDTNGLITTVAGNGNPAFAGSTYGTYSGDGGPATNAGLSNPVGIIVDASGNLFIGDQSNNRIRRVDTNSIITTVTGGGAGGDGSAATNASLNLPYGVALDAVGNLYIADSNNQRIREVQFAGSPTLTLFGTSTNNAGNYAVVVDGRYGSVTSTVATLTVVLPPSILVQPVSQRVLNGTNVTLDVTATGTQPFNYSWYVDATTLIQSGTNSTLNLIVVSPSNDGNYTVIITNAYGSVTSQVATLTVGFPPSATISGSQTVFAGTNVGFSVTAGGTGPISYQWQLNGVNIPTDIISTVAGGGTGGDGGAATKASLYNPRGVGLDAAGNMYIADAYNNRIRKVDTNGIITTVAGGGSGDDGGAATNASLNTPFGVAADTDGNLYIAESQNNRVRKVDTNGIISTVAGGGSDGDGGAATNASLLSPRAVTLDAVGNLYIADTANNRVRKVDASGTITTVAGGGSGGDGGAATNASLGYPSGVTFDVIGNLYIGDYLNNRVRKVDTNGIITTVAGTGSYGYSGDGSVATNTSVSYPAGISFDTFGNMYIADTGVSRIRKVDTSSFVTTVAGNGNAGYAGDGGAATNARLAYCYSVVSGASGNLYIADSGNNCIRKVQLNAQNPTITLNSVSAYNAGGYSVVVTSPYGCVTSTFAILTVQAAPVITVQPATQITVAGNSPTLSVTVAGSGPFGYFWFLASTNLVQNGTNSTLTLPNVFTNNAGNYTVAVTNNYGSVTSQIATLTVALPPSLTSQPASQTNLPGTTVAFNVTASGTGLFTYQWQFNGTNLHIDTITTIIGGNFGGFGGDGGAAINASLRNPRGVAFDGFGNLYIADSGNNRIRAVNTNGVITTVAGNGSATYAGDGGAATNASLRAPSSIAFDASGNVYIADGSNNRIRKLATNGIITTVAGNGSATYAGDGGTATNASLRAPSSVAFDAFGNLYIADSGNNRIRAVDTNGVITTVAGNGLASYAGDGGTATSASLRAPAGVAFDAFGNLYIADNNNNCIREVANNGIMVTVAGNGSATYAGDGGMATNASLRAPSGVAFDASGNLFIADNSNNRIREMANNGIIVTVAGNGSATYAGDGGTATNASLRAPSGVAFDAFGNLYIADNNNNRIREVHLATYPTLVLTNVSITNAGSYSVIITSPYGSVTSVVATLTVTIPRTPPQIISSGSKFDFLTNRFGFNLNGATGQMIVIDGSTNLVDWTPLFTNTVSSTPIYFFDSASTNFLWRFYRARVP